MLFSNAGKIKKLSQLVCFWYKARNKEFKEKFEARQRHKQRRSMLFKCHLVLPDFVGACRRLSYGISMIL